MNDQQHAQKDLLNRFKAGDKQAADQLFGEFLERAIAAARKRIAERRLRGSGAEDIAISAFGSLWRRVDQQFFSEDDLTDTNEFWRLLCISIRNKTETHFRRENAEKRGNGKVRGESVFIKSPGESSPGLAGESGNALTADEIIAFREHHQKLLAMLPENDLRELVTMRMEGYQISEIAETFALSDRTIKRKLAMIRELWQEEIDNL